jgi:predicted nucleic acid-binding protein
VRMALPEAERRELVARFARLSIAGGAVYDAMVAATAAHHEHRLLSCDRRAAPTYDRLGVDVIYL